DGRGARQADRPAGHRPRISRAGPNGRRGSLNEARWLLHTQQDDRREPGARVTTAGSAHREPTAGVPDATRGTPRVAMLPASGLGSSGVWRRSRRHRLAVGGAIAIAFLALCSIAAPILTPYSPNAVNLSVVAQAPTAQHLLGTDLVGRDVLTRLLYAGQ